jgi:hypothetical protein
LLHAFYILGHDQTSAEKPEYDRAIVYEAYFQFEDYDAQELKVYPLSKYRPTTLFYCVPFTSTKLTGLGFRARLPEYEGPSDEILLFRYGVAVLCLACGCR